MTEITVTASKSIHGAVRWKAEKRNRLWTPLEDLLRSNDSCNLDGCNEPVSKDPWFKVFAISWWGPGKYLPRTKTTWFCSPTHAAQWLQEWAAR